MTTSNDEQQVPAKNRWTRWYMWLLYVGAVFGVIGIIAGVAGSGDSAVANPEAQAASSESTPTPDHGKQTREAAEIHEQQTKEAEELAEQQTKEAENTQVTDTEYCEEINASVLVFYSSLLVIKEFDEAVATAKVAESGIDLLAQLDYIDRAATGIKSLNTPEDGKKAQRKARNVADDLMDKTDKVRKEYADMIKYSRSSSPDVDIMRIYVLDYFSATQKLREAFAEGVGDELYATKYCEGWGE